MLAYLKLIRLPNAFTALADIIAAYVVMNQFGSPATLAGLCGASATLYLSGMAFNDLADREEDARVRPNRPIPSSKVSVRGAALCGIILMLSGIGLTALSWKTSLPWAVLLAASILAYDFGTKGITVLGPVTLGLCRFFNVLLGSGASADDVLALIQSAKPFHAPVASALAIGIYAAGLTAFSAQEESGKQMRSILTGWIFCGAALLIAGFSGSPYAWIVLGPLTFLLALKTIVLAKTGTPVAARDLVRTGVMGVCSVDAGLVVGFAGLSAWPWAAGCLLLLVPSIIIAKWLAQKEA
jgi:4-hydroxybenzoate polyprenyltransferase